MNPRHLLTLGTLSLTLITSSTFAQSGHGNGAGLIYLNGVPRLADPWMKADHVKSTMIMSDEMVKLLKSIQALLELRGIRVKDFFDNQVFSELNEYRYTEKLPCDGRENLSVDANLKYENVACTSKSRTYILEEKFKSLSFLEQALTLLHERLHAKFPQAEHDWVTEFNSAILRMIELKTKQSEGDRTRISDEDFITFKNMYLVARKMGFNLSYDVGEKSLCRQSRMGGGLFCTLDPSLVQAPEEQRPQIKKDLDEAMAYLEGDGGVFLGVGAVITTGLLPGYGVLKNVVLLDSSVSSSWWSSYYGSLKPMTNSTIIGSTLNLTELSKAEITNSTLTNSKIHQSQITDSTVLTATIDESSIIKSNFQSISISHSNANQCAWRSYNYGFKRQSYIESAVCKNTTLAEPDNRVNIALQLDPGSKIENTTITVRRLGVRPFRYQSIGGRVRVNENTQVVGGNILYSAFPNVAAFKLEFDADAPLIFDPQRQYSLRTRNYLFNNKHRFNVHTVNDLSRFEEN